MSKKSNPRAIGAGGLRPAVLVGALAALAALAPAGASAQMTQKIEKTASPAARVSPAMVGLDQKLDNAIPTDAQFKDETGKTVRLGDYVGSRPLILNMIFYKCPGVCMQELEGMTRLFISKDMTLQPGRDFEVVTISINPAETPQMAAEKKQEFLSLIGRPGAARGWHFLTGTTDNIDRVAGAIGFRYAYDARNDQFAHPAGIVLVTPSGRISRYYYGTDYPAKDVRLSLVDASGNRIGSIADKIFVNCIYQYDPKTGRYGLTIMRMLQIGGIATVVTLFTSIVIMSRVFTRQAIRAEDLAAATAEHGVAKN